MCVCLSAYSPIEIYSTIYIYYFVKLNSFLLFIFPYNRRHSIIYYAAEELRWMAGWRKWPMSNTISIYMLLWIHIRWTRSRATRRVRHRHHTSKYYVQTVCALFPTYEPISNTFNMRCSYGMCMCVCKCVSVFGFNAIYKYVILTKRHNLMDFLIYDHKTWAHMLTHTHICRIETLNTHTWTNVTQSH